MQVSNYASGQQFCKYFKFIAHSGKLAGLQYFFLPQKQCRESRAENKKVKQLNLIVHPTCTPTC